MWVRYATVSKVDSTVDTVDTQVRELVQAGCERVFTDPTASMKITHRPGLNSALDYLRKDDTFVTLQLIRIEPADPTALETFCHAGSMWDSLPESVRPH
jgi:DNA invertase Pin-like site-specific DNA recombinase